MAHDSTFLIPEVAAQPTPQGGNVALYAKSDKQLYYKDDTGTENLIGSDTSQVTTNTAQTITGAKTMTGANAFNGTLGATTPAAITGTTITATTQLIGKGTATNDSAAAGDIGEVITAQTLIGTPVSLTTATVADIASISLTAGDWDVNGAVDFILTGATTTDWTLGISATTATLGAQDTYSKAPIVLTVHTDNYADVTPTVRISLAATTTIYLVASAAFSAGTVDAAGRITARRMR